VLIDKLLCLLIWYLLLFNYWHT